MSMIRRSVVCASLVALVTMPVPEAEACGGTFCDGGPNAMPVDQTGENILFVMGEGFTEAHIQIQYDPNTSADKFAWVIPLLAIPEFSVGSDALFDRILNGTVPSYGFTTQFDDSNCDQGGEGLAADGASGGDDGGDDGNGGGEGPEVVLQESVGAFEVTVLQGGTATEVMQWLGENGYQQDPAAEPILAEYLAEQYLFAAFKLTANAEVAEIHPVVLRFPTEEACVPLRLTRIAAAEDMDVRTFFLGEHRVVPRTYKHVLVNPLRLDWPNFAANYKEVITLAVDADMAGGKAFVTEYAGPSDVVFVDDLWTPAWNAALLAGTSPAEAVAELQQQGFLSCWEDWASADEVVMRCDPNHLLLPGLLQRYLPAPVGVEPSEFYGCISCFEAQIDFEAWDPAAFLTELDERIIAPAQHAVEIVRDYPTLTRMYTTISPAEMTTDPFFYENPDLPAVDLRNQMAIQETSCAEGELWTLPDGRQVYLPNGGPWPEFPNEMPWEEEVAELVDRGAPLVLADRSAEIDTLLADYNCAQGYPHDTCGRINDGDGGCRTQGGTSGWAPLAALSLLGGLAALRRRGRSIRIG